MQLFRVRNTIINLEAVCQAHYYTPTEDDTDKDRELIIWLGNKETEHFYGDEADFVWALLCNACVMQMNTREEMKVVRLPLTKVEA
ncbi:MAG: hypothetical protein SFY66_18625 [Oculatellaceae cyanobacterium bins.114]|nr:hypothetical protein [Oculatellaceae cyanobacterium bins.114]